MSEEPKGSVGTAAPRIGVRSILGERSIRVVMLITFVIMVGFGIIAPILPLYARSFGVGYDAAGLLIASFAIMRLVFDLFAGPIVDRFGEQAAGVGGLVFVAVSSVLAGLAPNFALAVVFRGVGGAGSAVLFAALYSYILKVVPKDRMARTLGVFYGSFDVGFVAGGPIGGVVSEAFGLRSPLYLYGALCLVSALLYLRFVPNPAGEPARARSGERETEGTVAAIRRLLRTRTFVTVVVLNMSFFWVIAGGFDTLVPLFGDAAFGMSKLAIGVVISLGVATEFALLYPSGSAADRFGRKAIVIPAAAWLLWVLIATAWSPNVIVFGAAIALLGVGSGALAVAPAAMLSDIVPERQSGTAVGVFRFFGDLGFVLGPLSAGVAARAAGFRWAFAVVAAPLVLTLALILRTPETVRRAAPVAEPAPHA